MSQHSHLRVVPSTPAKKEPKPPRCMKITLWLTAAEWLVFMQRSASMERGKTSVNAYFREVMGLDKANETVDKRSVAKTMRNMRVPLVPVVHRHARTHAHAHTRKRAAA